MKSYIADDFKHGKNFEHGFGCIIESDVIVGDNVTIGHNVILKSGTRIMNNVNLADGVHTTGICIIGNNVMVRTGSCISKSVIINDYAFIGAGIMSSHTRNVYHGRPNMERKQLITRIGYGCIIGSRTNLTAGVRIEPGIIVGYDSNVTKDLSFKNNIYEGNPAWGKKEIKPGSPWIIDIPEDYKEYEFDKEMLNKYLPYAVVK